MYIGLSYKAKGGKSMDKMKFKIISQVQSSIKLLGEELKQDLLKGLKFTLTDNAVTIKVAINNLEKEEN